MRNTPFEFNLRTHTKIGEKTALNLGLYIKEMGLSRPALIIDRNVASLPYIQQIIQGIPNALVWEYDIPGEPDYDSLDRIKKKFIRARKPLVDSFIAIGGGSVIDIAKGLATLVTNPGPARKYRGFPTGLNPSLPVIALPTVAGTGSEVTYNASFIDWKEKRKMGINTFHNFPRLSILDPLLTIECPRAITISSAMDSLVHALESYATPQANELSRIFSKAAIKYGMSALPTVVKNLKNTTVRLGLQFSAYLAGIAIVQVGGGPASILSYPLGVHGKVAHGLAGAVFLPFVVEHNAKKGYDYSELYDQFAKGTSQKTRKEKSLAFAEKLFELHDMLEIPKLFARYPLVKENASLIFKEIEALQKGFDATNPIPFTVKDARQIFTQILDSSF